jgi:flagellar basal body-associated protein FliL
MTTIRATDTTDTATRTGLRWTYVVLIVIVTIAVTAGLTYWLLNQYLFLKEFKPVQLKPKEEQVLNSKLQAIGIDLKDAKADSLTLEPERYSEADAKREVLFSEREINAMLAKNTDLAHKLAIDLSDDLVSAKLLIPLDNDFPVLGGKTLRVNAGIEMAYKDSRPIVVLKGVSVMGVPIPNAWLGNLKNVDLVKEFGGDRGFWKTFADGVEYIRVVDGQLLVKLKE